MAPMQRQLRKALGVVKDQTSISLAKVASNGAPELDVALVKATSHDEAPVEEKYLQEILHLTSCSRSYALACIAGISRRLAKTRNWIVAIKALMLIHRLLRDGDPALEQEFLYAGARGMRVLHLSDFRDDSHSNGWDYSAFVRTYALFLDERLDSAPAVKMLEARSSFHGRRSYSFEDYGSHHRDYGSHHGFENGGRDSSPGHKKGKAAKDMTFQELLERIPSLQRLLERVLACRPTGAAKIHRLVQIALYPIVRESFQVYSDICEGLAVLLDAFFEMEHHDSIKAFEIYSRGAKQADELASFYGFCRNVGICRSWEFPVVNKIGEDLLETMEDFLRDRSSTNLRGGRPELKSQESLDDCHPEEADETIHDINGIKSLPAPPVENPIPQAETTTLQKQEGEADLLNLDHATISCEEHGDRLALVLFSGTDSNVNKSWQPFTSSGTCESSDANAATSVLSDNEKGASGWELALVASASELSKSKGKPLAGGFDRLLLDSLYDQAADYQKQSSALQSGSLSSVALTGRQASLFLALPAPPVVQQAGGEDPFAASLNFPPPSYVQMNEMTKKQQLLVQEQKIWYAYERDGMQGYNGLLKYYNNQYLAPLQNAYSVPYYSTGRSAAY